MTVVCFINKSRETLNILKQIKFHFLKYSSTSTKMGKHKSWRRLVKKLRRKKIRQKIAQERDRKIQEEEERNLKDPLYQEWLKHQILIEEAEQEAEKQKHDEEEEQWLRQELLAQKRFREEQKKREENERAKEEERLRIQKEFEEQQKIALKKREEAKRLLEEKQKEYERFMLKITEFLEGKCELPIELLNKTESNPGKEICPFFAKTGACRFGERCSRNHLRSQISKILLFPHFFSHIKFEQSRNTEYGADIALEFTEKDVEKDFDDFFADVTGELQKFGRIKNFRTCKNNELHLRGNVYVEYEEERDSLRAYTNLQGRYYAGKQINVEFCSLNSWKAAICGLSIARKCPKGNNCNFLHIFRNPGNKYNHPLNETETSVRSNRSTKNQTKIDSNWNDVDNNEKRNWRWSETPERLVKQVSKSAEHSRYISVSASTEKRKRSRSHKRSISPQSSRSSPQNIKRNSESRNRSGHKSSRSRSKSHSSSSRDKTEKLPKNDKRSSSRSRKESKKKSRSRSKERKRKRKNSHKKSKRK